MRRITFLFLSIVALIASAEPELKWIKKSHNFGIFKEEDGLTYCTFKAVNIGNEPAVVIDAKANCGCTKPTYPREPIAPGDTLVVNVAYNPASRPGKFNKHVKITSNAKNKTDVLSVRGTVLAAPSTMDSRYPHRVGPYRINNTIAPFGGTIKGRVLAAGVQIYNPTADTIKPMAKNIPPYISLVFKPKSILPGEQGVVSMTAYTEGIDQYGFNEDTLTLFPSASSNDSINITLVAQVREDFSKLTPMQLEQAPVARISSTTADFASIDSTVSTKSTIEITLSNIGKNPLKVHQVYSNNKAISTAISSTTINSGAGATISISLDPTLLDENQRLSKMLNANITIVTNDPKSPEQVIRAVGQIQ